jgi:hypothetical protein
MLGLPPLTVSDVPLVGAVPALESCVPPLDEDPPLLPPLALESSSPPPLRDSCSLFGAPVGMS